MEDNRNYGKGNNPKPKRNLQIYLDKMGFSSVKAPTEKPDKKQLSYTELVKKYGLSTQWMQTLINRWRRRLSDSEQLERWKKEWQQLK